MLVVEVTQNKLTVKRGTVTIAEWTFDRTALAEADVARLVEVSLAYESKPCGSVR